MTEEHVVLLDEQDKPSGTLEKYAAHTLNTPLHLAFSCWLFNEEGQLLVTRRSLSKKAWPGVWTNSVCGHPQQGETTEEAILRRCRFELGVEITDLTPSIRTSAIGRQIQTVLWKMKSVRYLPRGQPVCYRLTAKR